MLTSRDIVKISNAVDTEASTPIDASTCSETASQLRIDRMLRQSIPAAQDADAQLRAMRIIDSINAETPLHLRPHRFAAAPFISVAAVLTIVAGLTVLMSKSSQPPRSTSVVERPALNASELVSTPYVTEARLLAEDTSRATDTVFSYLPRMRE